MPSYNSTFKMMSLAFPVLLLAVLGTCLAGPTAAPQQFDFKPVHVLSADIPTCRQSDANLNACIKAGFQQMTPRLKEGIKELNIPPLDPFVLEKSNYHYDNGVLQGQIALRHVHIHGLSESEVQSVDFQLQEDEKKVILETVTRVPQLLVEGGYKADMKFNDVKLTPKGFFNISMTDVVFTAHYEGELYERGDDGHRYLRLTKFENEPEVGGMRIYASGLLPEPNLNAILLDFINQYWQPIYKVMLPETRSTWEPLVLQAANEFFAALPFDLLLRKD